MSDKLNRIQSRHIKKALSYIIQRGVLNDKGIYYLERKGSRPNGYSPNGWATKYKGKWIGMNEVARVSYLFAIKGKSNLSNSKFSDSALKKFGHNGSQAKTLLEKHEFLCEFRSMPDKINQIQRRDIAKALEYIVLHGVLNRRDIYYLRREGNKPNRCSPNKWEAPISIGIGVRELVRVAYLFSNGKKPIRPFDDDQLCEVGEHSSTWQKMLKERGFPCDTKKPRIARRGG